MRHLARACRFGLIFAVLWGSALPHSGHAETPPPAVAASEHFTNPQPDLARACTDAGDSPVCAFKAWVACVLYDAQGPCRNATDAHVAPQGPPATTDRQVLKAPWALPFERLMPEAFGFELFDGGPVPAGTVAGFKGATDSSASAPFVIPAGGAYELFAGTMDLGAPEWNLQISVLLAPTNGKWRVIAWSSSRSPVCTAESGTAGWPPCRLFIKRPVVRDLQRPLLWSWPQQPGLDPNHRPGVDRQVETAGIVLTAPIAGVITRRPRVYLDAPVDRWVVIDAPNGDTAITMKLAFVSAEGPPPGAHVDVTTPIGRQQAAVSANPSTGPFVHWEVMMYGRQIDPIAFVGSVAQRRRARR